jgi:hypothetical protein
MNQYKFNLVYHFLVLVESPVNFILSIIGSVKFLRLSEWYVLQTEYSRVVDEYQSALNVKIKQHDESIKLARKASEEDNQNGKVI